MTNGILSPHEATVIVSLTDPASDKPLSRIAELFINNFREDTSRVRAIFALRTLLGFESTTNGSALLPTSPEVIGMLFLLHIASVPPAADTKTKDSLSPESRDFAAAALYEHLLRVEDLLRDDALMSEQRKYRAQTVVGAPGKDEKSGNNNSSNNSSPPANAAANNNNNGNAAASSGAKNDPASSPKQKTRDAIEQDAYRGHLLQKVFIVQCLINQTKSSSASSSEASSTSLVIDFSKPVSAVCSETTLEALETAITAWGATSESRTQISDSISRLKSCYERENQQQHGSSSSTNSNNLSGMNFSNRTVSAIVPDNGVICEQAKKGTKHFLTTNASEMGLSTSAFITASNNNSETNSSSSSSLSNNNNNNNNTIFIAPHAAVVAPPVNRARVIRDARYLLPPSNPFVLDTSSHPQDWREGKSLIEAAINGTELTAQQLSKLSTLLSVDSSSSASAAASSNGGKNSSVAAKGGKGGKNDAKDTATAAANLDLFPYLGLTPQTFGRIARSSPKVAAAILNSCASRFASNNNSDAYIKELIDFQYATNPDFCPTVVLAASKNGLVTASHLSTYINRAKAYSNSCINGKEKNDFLKSFCVSLHQIAEKTPLDSSDKSAVAAMLNGISELADVAKLWS